jgi:hypothetical protein
MSSSLAPFIPGGEEGNRSFTNQLWTGINMDSIEKEYGYGYGWTKRFDQAGVYATTVAQDGIYPFQDSGDTINGAKIIGGGLTLATAATDNNSPTIQWGGTTGSLFHVSKTSPRALGFEAIVRFGTIVETGTLIGLGEEGMAANNGCLVDDTGAIASKDFFGYRAAMHASVMTIQAVYRLAGQAEVVPLSTALTVVVNTDYALGFRYGGHTDRPDRQKHLEWWVNGTKVKDLDGANTTTVPTAGCPFDELVSPLFCIKAGEAGAKTMTIRQMRVGQRW